MDNNFSGETPASEIGARLRRLRARKGQTQAAMAQAVGVTRQQIVYYEQGHTRLSRERLVLVAAFLDITPEALAFPGPTPRGGGGL